MGLDALEPTTAADESKQTPDGGQAFKAQEHHDFTSGAALDQNEARVSRPSQSRKSSTTTIDGRSNISEGERPPLPPRPTNHGLLGDGKRANSLRIPKRSARPNLQSHAITAVSRTDIETLSYPDGSRETYANSTRSTPSGKSFQIDSPAGQSKGRNISDGDDSASLKSYAPTIGGEVESLLGDVIGRGQQSPAWRLLSNQMERNNPFDLLPYDKEEPSADFSREFDELEDLDPAGDNEGRIGQTTTTNDY